DSRVFDMLHCDEDGEIEIEGVSTDIPTCNEIQLDIISQRDIHNQAVAHAISERIDDFQEHFEGLILQPSQQFEVSELGIRFVVRSMNPIGSQTKAARIAWKNLLKINLGTLDTKPCNLCLIIEVAAATQIADVSIGSDVMTRHQAIIDTLSSLESELSSYNNQLQFAAYVYSDEVHPFVTFNSQSGEESEITSLDSPSLIKALRKWVDTSLDEFLKNPSNPGLAIKNGLERAQTLSGMNGFPTTIVFFSSGVYSAGQNPVMVTRKNKGDKDVRFLAISVGIDSATDIMDAIAKEGNGISIHLDSDSVVNSIVDKINDIMKGAG
ncbi:MAG: vWA domain-containing protein, partial [Candidatus Thorarchaeota archaeon]